MKIENTIKTQAISMVRIEDITNSLQTLKYFFWEGAFLRQGLAMLLISLYNPSLSLNYNDPGASASQMLRLQACITIPGLACFTTMGDLMLNIDPLGK